MSMRKNITIPVEIFMRLRDAAFSDGEVQDTKIEEDVLPYVGICMLPEYHFAGTRWFRKSAGHSLTKLRLYANGELVHEAVETGHGDHYLQMGINWLKDQNARLPGRPVGSTLYVREELHSTYEVHDVAREKDL
jgi:hypothetical protein